MSSRLVALRQRAQRAHRSTHPLNVWRPAFSAIVGAGFGGLWARLTNEHASMSAILVPTAVGLLVFFASIGVLYALEFSYRFVTCKARKGTNRTLDGVNTTGVKNELRRDIPTGNSMVTTLQTVEIQDFCNDLLDLFGECGWHFAALVWAPSLGTRNVEIHLPSTGNQGLLELAKLLNRIGYRTAVIPGTGPHVEIRIGEQSP